MIFKALVLIMMLGSFLGLSSNKSQAESCHKCSETYNDCYQGCKNEKPFTEACYAGCRIDYESCKALYCFF